MKKSIIIFLLCLVSIWAQADQEANMIMNRVDDPNRPQNAITDVYIIYGPDSSCAQNYSKLNQDLNEDAGGQYIYLCYTTDLTLFDPITNFTVSDSGFFSSPINPEGYTCVRDVNSQCADLNTGTAGRRIYLNYIRDPSLGQYVQSIQIFRSYPVTTPGYIVSPINLNEDTDGTTLYLGFTVIPGTNASASSNATNATNATSTAVAAMAPATAGGETSTGNASNATTPTSNASNATTTPAETTTTTTTTPSTAAGTAAPATAAGSTTPAETTTTTTTTPTSTTTTPNATASTTTTTTTPASTGTTTSGGQTL